MAGKTEFRDALRLNEPGNPTLPLLAEAAYLWSYRRQHDKAARIFQALTLLAPADPVGHLGLSEVYLSQLKWKEADKEAEAAIRLDSIDRRTMAFALKLRGKALLQLRKVKEAEKQWQKAIDLDPGGPEGQAAQVLMDISRELGILSGSPAGQ